MTQVLRYYLVKNDANTVFRTFCGEKYRKMSGKFRCCEWSYGEISPIDAPASVILPKIKRAVSRENLYNSPGSKRAPIR